jgi:ABC-2 type transport system ATP-binding protein
MNEVIRTESLTKKYRSLRALEGVNLDIREGSVYALVGPNGAGKTTLIRILMNLIQASSGCATVLGMNSKNVRGSAFTQIGYVSENQEIPGWMRVGELLDYLHSFYPTWDTSLEANLLIQFSLPRDRKVKALSRGMRMKLALASALAFHPKLIVLDEPFGGLDPLVRDELIASLRERAQEATVFLSSHDLTEIESFASHIGYLDNGRLQFSEDLGALLSRFREIELVFDALPQFSDALPAAWLQTKQSSTSVTFVEAHFEQQNTADQVHRVFANVKDILYKPMTLRSVVLAMARRSGEVSLQ